MLRSLDDHLAAVSPVRAQSIDVVGQARLPLEILRNRSSCRIIMQSAVDPRRAIHPTRHLASICLAATDHGLADGLILLSSPPAGEGLL